MTASVDAELLIDPLFRQMTQKFDEISMGNLMSSRLNANSDLLIQLDSSMPQSLFSPLDACADFDVIR